MEFVKDMLKGMWILIRGVFVFAMIVFAFFVPCWMIVQTIFGESWLWTFGAGIYFLIAFGIAYAYEKNHSEKMDKYYAKLYGNMHEKILK